MIYYPQRDEDKLAIWLFIQDIPGMGPARIKSLYDQGGQSLDNMFELISQLPNNTGWLANLQEALINPDLKKYYDVIERTYNCSAKICTLDDPLYPKNLRKSNTAPGILFYKGRLDNISERSLALVGTVTPTENGQKRAEKFARLCAQNQIQVISGLARGIDTASHKAALKYAGLTYAIVGHGIDYCYPPENKELFDEIVQNGAVISQFQTGTKPMPWMFPARNETMCTISSGTVIIEAHEKCGSLIQAKHSFKHQRRVFLLSANLEGEPAWAINLVDQGADVVKEFDIVLERMGHINKEFIEKITIKEQNLFEIDNKKPTKAYLFDLDNVLYNSFGLMEEVYIETVRQIKAQVTDKDIGIIKDKINNAPPYVFKCLGINSIQGNDLYKRIYLDRIKQGITFFPGIDQLINKLSDKGFSLGIVTSQPYVRYTAIMQHAGFKDLIKTEVTWNDLKKAEQKPHPAGILKALETLSIEPFNSVYIGDDVKDIQAAKAAGAHSIAALWGAADEKNLLNSNPDFVAKQPSDVLTYEF